jgi:hypothetical protein
MSVPYLMERAVFVLPGLTSSHFNAIDIHYNSHSLSSIFRCPPPPPLLVYYPAPHLHDNIHVYCQPFLSRRCVSLSHALVPRHLAHTALSLPTSTPTRLSIAQISYNIDNTLPCSTPVPHECSNKQKHYIPRTEYHISLTPTDNFSSLQT